MVVGRMGFDGAQWILLPSISSFCSAKPGEIINLNLKTARKLQPHLEVRETKARRGEGIRLSHTSGPNPFLCPTQTKTKSHKWVQRTCFTHQKVLAISITILLLYSVSYVLHFVLAQCFASFYTYTQIYTQLKDTNKMHHDEHLWRPCLWPLRVRFNLLHFLPYFYCWL